MNNAAGHHTDPATGHKGGGQQVMIKADHPTGKTRVIITDKVGGEKMHQGQTYSLVIGKGG